MILLQRKRCLTRNRKTICILFSNGVDTSPFSRYTFERKEIFAGEWPLAAFLKKTQKKL
jgi:hypothetical protein